MLRIVLSTFLVLIVLGGLGTPSAAQDSVPRELVLALLQGYEHPGQEAEPQFVVGQLPRGVPAEAVPKGADILGGVWTSNRATAAIRLYKPYREAHAALVEAMEQLQRTGWQPAPFSTTIFTSREHQLARLRSPAPLYCKDGATLRTSFQQMGNGAMIRIDVGTGSEPHRCMRQHERLLAGKLPELQAPEGTEVQGRTTSTGPDYFDTRAEVTTTLTPAELVAHYSAQFTAAGWSTAEHRASETLASQVLRFQDEQGKQWLGTLIATAVPELAERELRLQVQRERGAPAMRKGP
jgi:hypothetical protein